jgi:hypothetical protein
MPATGGFDRDAHQAKGAILGGGGCGRFLLFVEFVDVANQKEYGEGYDQEADKRIDKNPHVHRNGSRRLCRRQRGIRTGGLCPISQNQKQVGKIHIAQDKTDGRHDHIGYEGIHDGSEGGPDDNPDGHVQHVTSHDEFLKILNHILSPFSPGAELKSSNLYQQILSYLSGESKKNYGSSMVLEKAVIPAKIGVQTISYPFANSGFRLAPE